MDPPEKSRNLALLLKALWTVGGYGASLSLKLGSNVVLSRLLAPEILGVMAIINSIRYGAELLTDVGIEQNIIHHEHGLDLDFFNTAWTLQILRGMFLSVIFLLLTPFLASFYGIDVALLSTMSAVPLLGSLTSTSIFGLVKRLEVKARNLFELKCELFGFAATVSLASITPTAWAPVLGALCAVGGRAALSYTLPHPPHRITLRLAHVREIITYGKWIIISSIVLYVSTNLDRIFLGRMEALSILGIYSLARTIADLPPALAGRLSYQLVFPIISAAQKSGDLDAVAQLSRVRLAFILLASVVLGTVMAWSDLAIRILYDTRYFDAGWMLFVLLSGAWFAVLANLNEAILLGYGRPAYSGFANGMRFATLLIGLPIGFKLEGILGGLLAIASGEVVRYITLMVIQRRLGKSYFRQDLLATAVMIFVVSGWAITRNALHLGLPWSGFTGVRS